MTSDGRRFYATDAQVIYDGRVPDVGTASVPSSSLSISGVTAHGSRTAATIAAILLMVTLAAAVSVDVVKTTFGTKSDESTYVAMALSLAYDHDLSYERRDLERYVGLYRSGPHGIFLKRGKQLRLRVDGKPPFLHLRQTPDARADRLYFGKAMIYPLVAAPFVRLLGLNGLLVLNVLLLFVACVCGYLFLAARSRPASALVFTLAFVGASCVPVYTVFLMPEVLNFSLVFCAYFLWLYKEVAPSTSSTSSTGRGWLHGVGSDVGAAVLLGVATYSKLNHAILIAPIVCWWWWRRRFGAGLIVAAVFAILAGGLFGVNALNSGEFNYQGGDRRSCSSAFPFDGSKERAWDTETKCRGMTTNDADTETVLAPSEFLGRFGHNIEYFLVGRHFGFVPYFFPGVVCLALWLASPERWRPWRVLTFLAIVGSVLAWLVFFPYSWSGGGGPPGNRYFMSQYPAFLFLLPPLTSTAPALLAWAGGALFTAKMLVNPFVTAKSPFDIAARGFARRLPVELPMANDLPIALDEPRAHIWYADVLLSFLDYHAYIPEEASGRRAIWVAGDGRADILVRCEWPIDRLTVTAASPIRTELVISMGRSESRVAIGPGTPVTFDVPVSGVRGLNSYAYLLSARSTEAFTPSLRDPSSTDNRNLGVLMTFKAVPASQVAPGPDGRGAPAR